MIPKYSAKALYGVAHLFKKFNDIDIFIEDTANRAMSETIFKKIIEDKYKLFKLHQLGGRQAIIDRCSLDQKETGRKKLYLIDGDLNLLIGNNPTHLKFLYCLKVYCTENLLLNKDALVKVAYQDAGKLSMEDIESSIELNTLYQSIERLALPLFINYAIAHDQNTGIQTVQFGLYKLTVDEKGRVLDRARIRARLLTLKKELIALLGADVYFTTRQEIKNSINKYTQNKYHLVSAKEFTLRMIYQDFKVQFNTKCSYDQFKSRLASELNDIVDLGLKAELLA